MDLENIRSYNMGKYGVSPPLIISGCKFRSRWWWDGPVVGLGLMAMRTVDKISTFSSFFCYSTFCEVILRSVLMFS